MSCPFAGLATRYTVENARVSVRICGAVPYERDSDPDDLPLPTVCFSKAAWESCPHYIRLTARKEIARQLGMVVDDDAGAAEEEVSPAVFEAPDGTVQPERRHPATHEAG
jgi:hypothetical protein